MKWGIKEMWDMKSRKKEKLWRKESDELWRKKER